MEKIVEKIRNIFMKKLLLIMVCSLLNLSGFAMELPEDENPWVDPIILNLPDTLVVYNPFSINQLEQTMIHMPVVYAQEEEIIVNGQEKALDLTQQDILLGASFEALIRQGCHLNAPFILAVVFSRNLEKEFCTVSCYDAYTFNTRNHYYKVTIQNGTIRGERSAFVNFQDPKTGNSIVSVGYYSYSLTDNRFIPIVSTNEVPYLTQAIPYLYNDLKCLIAQPDEMCENRQKILDYCHALREQPYLPHIQLKAGVLLGDLYYSEGNTKKACECYNRVSFFQDTYMKERYKAQLRLVKIYLNNKDTRKASQLLQILSEQELSLKIQIEAWWIFADFYQENNNIINALQYLKRITNQDEFLVQRVKALYQMGLLYNKCAVQEIDKALEYRNLAKNCFLEIYFKYPASNVRENVCWELGHYEEYYGNLSFAQGWYEQCLEAKDAAIEERAIFALERTAEKLKQPLDEAAQQRQNKIIQRESYAQSIKEAFNTEHLIALFSAEQYSFLRIMLTNEYEELEGHYQTMMQQITAFKAFIENNYAVILRIFNEVDDHQRAVEFCRSLSERTQEAVFADIATWKAAQKATPMEVEEAE